MTMPQPAPYQPNPALPEIVAVPEGATLYAAPAPMPAPAAAPGLSIPDKLAWAPMDFSKPTFKRMVMSLTGHQKTGKTHWSLMTTPEPVYYANIDIGTEGVAHKMVGRSIQEVVVRYEVGWQQAQYQSLWKQLMTLYDDALASESGTLVIDSETENWELQMLSEFGRTSQIMPRNRQNLNTEKRAFINKCLESKINVVFCSRTKEVWANEQNTGQYARRGYNALDFDIQLVAWTAKRWNPALSYDAQQRPVGGTEYGVQVIDTRFRGEMEGQTYWGATARFDMLLEMSWA